jgi:hypothetical protein
MRDNGVWFYGIINLTHIVGVATLFGSVVILDLRLLGFWPDAPLAAISRPTTRMAAAGFGHWTGPAQRIPRSPFIRLARVQEPRPDIYGAPAPCRHGRHLVVPLANLNLRRPYDRLLVSSAAIRICPSGERSLPKSQLPG